MIAIGVIVVIVAGTRLIPEKKLSEYYEGYDLSTLQSAVSAGTTYSEYLEMHKNAAAPNLTVAVDVFAYDAEQSTGVSIVNNYEGKDAVKTEDNSFILWSVEVPQAGFYNISMDYICPPSRNLDVERILYINGEMPFNGADTLSFSRLWKDGGEI